MLFSQRATAKALLAGLILSAPVITVADSVLPPKPVLAIMRFLARFFHR